MYKLSQIINEIKQLSFATPNMVKDLYDKLMSNLTIVASEVDNILLKYGIDDYYRYDIFRKIDMLKPNQLTEIYKKFLSLKKDLEN